MGEGDLFKVPPARDLNITPFTAMRRPGDNEALHWGFLLFEGCGWTSMIQFHCLKRKAEEPGP
jgi:hypothetical protein